MTMAAPRLACVRCGATTAVGASFEGCLVCPGDPRPALEVVYDYAMLAAAGTLKTWAARAGGLWRFRELLPPAPDATLGFDAGTRRSAFAPGRDDPDLAVEVAYRPPCEALRAASATGL